MTDTRKPERKRVAYSAPKFTKLGSLVSLVAGGTGPTYETNGPGVHCVMMQAMLGANMMRRPC